MTTSRETSANDSLLGIRVHPRLICCSIRRLRSDATPRRTPHGGFVEPEAISTKALESRRFLAVTHDCSTNAVHLSRSGKCLRKILFVGSRACDDDYQFLRMGSSFAARSRESERGMR